MYAHSRIKPIRNYSLRRVNSLSYSRIYRSWSNTAVSVKQHRPISLDEAVASTLEMKSYAAPAAKPIAVVQSDNDTAGDKSEEVPVAAINSSKMLV
jgi:hypothetical protein